MSPRQLLEHQLRTAGYRERRDGTFHAPYGRRTIALLDATASTEDWSALVDRALRQETFRAAPSWSRYVVLVLSCPKTVPLAAAAAAFCRDVSRCRKLVAFGDENGPEALPFLALSATNSGRGTPGGDLEEIATRLLPVPELVSAFLDESTATAHVRTLAENLETGHD